MFIVEFAKRTVPGSFWIGRQLLPFEEMQLAKDSAGLSQPCSAAHVRHKVFSDGYAA